MSIDVESAGAAATAALAARELESTGQSHTSAGDAAACANCTAPLAGAYCHRCGQSAHVHRSLWHMLEEAMHGVLHFDTKSWRTLLLLIARPGVLTRRYIVGQRVRYVSPLALFLFTVFLMFFLVSQLDAPLGNVTLSSAPARDLVQAEIKTAPALQAEEIAAPARAAAPPPATSVQPAQQSKRGLNINFVLPRWAENSAANARLDRALGNPELTLYKVKNTAYKFSFLLIPISLPFLWLMFCRRPDVTVYDHMVFSLYSLSFMSLWAVLVVWLRAYETSQPWSWAMFLVPPVHMYLQLRETYALGWFATLWRTAALLLMAGTMFLLFLAAVLSLSVW